MENKQLESTKFPGTSAEEVHNVGCPLWSGQHH